MDFVSEQLCVPGDYDTSRKFLVPAEYETTGQFSDQRYRLAAFCMEKTAHRKERQEEGEHFILSSEQYRALFGGVGSTVVTIAEKEGLIERTNHSAGRKSKYARLTDRYRSGRFRVVEIGHKQRSSPEVRQRPLDEVSQWQLDNINRFSLPAYFKVKNDWDAYLAHLYLAGKRRVSRDSVGRLHSSITPMSRELRSQLRVVSPFSVQHIVGSAFSVPIGLVSSSQRALVEIDVKTCQPLLIGAGALNESIHARADVYEWLEICQHSDLYEYLRKETDSALSPVCRCPFEQRFR